MPAEQEAPPAARRQSRCGQVLASFGLVADIYDLTIINIVRPSLEAEFGALSPVQDGALTAAALAGAIVGQICFGAVADRFGRRRVFIVTAVIICLASLASSLAQERMLGFHVYAALAILRFIMGLGIGGEYPLAAANTMENVSPEASGQALAVTFSGMTVGSLLAPLVVIVLTAGFGVSAEKVWRPAFAFGALLAALCAVLRMALLEETSAYQEVSERQASRREGAEEQSSKGNDEANRSIDTLFNMRRSLAGTAGSWLLYDVVTYGVGMFSTTIFGTEPGLDSAGVTLLISALTVPGILTAIIITKYMRMLHLQLLGLGLMFCCFCILVVVHTDDQESRLRYVSSLLVFSVMRSFDSMGPGVTTFSVPGQIFPTQVRGTAHGISAAFGKLGAVVGTFVFPFLNNAYGSKVVMAFMAFMCYVTMVWTWGFTPSYGPEELAEIGKLDPCMPADRQGTLAERVLFGEETKALTIPIAAAAATSSKA